MNYGDSTQPASLPVFFTETAGTSDAEAKDHTSKDNLNLNNWDNVSPDRNPQAIGGRILSSPDVPSNEMGPLPMPNPDGYNLPAEAYDPTSESLAPVGQNPADLAPAPPTPELGQITPIDSTPDHPTAIEGADANFADFFIRKQAMSGEKLSSNSVKRIDERIKKLKSDDDIASFVSCLDSARETFQGKNLGGEQ